MGMHGEACLYESVRRRRGVRPSFWAMSYGVIGILANAG